MLIKHSAHAIHRRLRLCEERPLEKYVRFVHQIGKDKLDTENVVECLGRKTGDNFAEMEMIG